MRGYRETQVNFVSLIDVEQLIAPKHPIRAIKRMCDEVLGRMSPFFDEIYAAAGAPSVPPETLLKGKVLQALFTVRSDRQLCARLQTDLMFRWFVDLPLDEAPFDASTYSKNQDRLLHHQMADLFFAEVVDLARRHGWVSDEQAGEHRQLALFPADRPVPETETATDRAAANYFFFSSMTAACAAARRATGTRKGEQET